MKDKKLQPQDFDSSVALKKLLDVGQLLAAVQDLDSLLQSVAESAGSALGADVVILYEYLEEIGDVKVPPVVWGWENIRYPEVLKERSGVRPHKESAVFKMLSKRRKKPFYASNAKKDWARIFGEEPQEKGKLGSFLHREDIASSAAVRLIADGERVGVLLVNYRTHHIFPGEERMIIELFATQAAAAIRDARLRAGLGRQIERLQTLNQVSRTLSAELDDESVFEAVVRAVVQTLECTHCTFFVLEDNLLVPRASHSQGKDIKITRCFALGEGLAGKVAQEGKPILACDAKKLKYFVEGRTRPDVDRSMIVVPVKVDGQVIGVISADQDRVNAFDERDLQMVETLALQTETAIQNANLLRQEQRRAEVMELLQKVQQDVDTAIDLQDVLDRVLRQAVDSIGGKDGSLMLMEEDGRLHFRTRVGGLFPVDKIERTFTPGAKDEGIAGWVTRNCKPYVCRDTKTDSKFVDIVAGHPIRSLVSVPIISHGTVLGVINVDSSEPNRFSVTDAGLLASLADQIAVTIERAELLESLRQIGEKTLGGAEDLHQYIVGAVHRLTRCPATMWRVDNTGKQARIVASRGVRTEYAQQAVVDLDRSVIGKAIREREVVPVLDIQADSDFQNKEAAAKEGWHSYLAVPLLAGPERAVGTLSIYSERKREQFTRWELDVLRTFAGQAGVVVRNADLVEELAVLNRIGQTVSVLGVDAIANLVYREVSQLVDTTNFFLCLYDKDKNRLDIKAWMYDGCPLEPFSCELSGLTSWIVRERKPLLIRDWDEEERDFPVKADIVTERQRSWLGVPLLIGEEVLGVISVQSPYPNTFDLDTQRTLEIIASQAAVTIKNAHLYEESQNRLKLLSALNETSLDIVQRLKLGELMPAIIERAANLMAGDHRNGIGAAYWRCDHKAQRAIIEHSFNPSLVGMELDCDEGLVGEVVRTGKAQYVNDYPQWPKRATIFDRGDLAGLIKNIIEVPVKQDGKVVAILAISDTSGQRLFGDADTELLERFANLAAIAIENARLFEDAQRRIRDLKIVDNVVRIISTKLDTRDLLQEIVSQVADRLHCSHCTIFFPRKEKGELLLVPQVTHGVHSEQIKTRRFKLNEGLAGWVFQHGESLALDDARGDPRFAPARARRELPRSMLVAPMKVGDQTIGVISADHNEFGWFSESDRRLVDALALQAGIAIERARGLALLQNIGNQIISAPNVDDILQQIVSGAIKLTNTDSGVIYLISEDGQSVVESFHPPGFEHPRPRLEKKEGLTRYVIETGGVLCIADTHKDPRVNPVLLEHFRAMIAVPLKIEQKVIGVLYLNDNDTHDFTETEISLLSTLTSQAAAAIENARLNDQRRKAQERAIAVEKLAVTSQVAAEFAHRMINLAGTIPIRVRLAKRNLTTDDPNDARVLEQLEGMDSDTQNLLQAAQEMRRTTESRAPEDVVVNELLELAIERVWFSEPDIEGRIRVKKDLADDLPTIRVERNRLLDTLVSMVRNGVEAISREGTLTVSTQRGSTRGRPCIEIAFSDTGGGIPVGNLPKVFDLFTTWEEELGFGLGRERIFIKGLGGDIDVESVEGKGSKFIIQIPVGPEAL